MSYFYSNQYTDSSSASPPSSASFSSLATSPNYFQSTTSSGSSSSSYDFNNMNSSSGLRSYDSYNSNPSRASSVSPTLASSRTTYPSMTWKDRFEASRVLTLRMTWSFVLWFVILLLPLPIVQLQTHMLRPTCSVLAAWLGLESRQHPHLLVRLLTKTRTHSLHLHLQIRLQSQITAVCLRPTTTIIPSPTIPTRPTTITKRHTLLLLAKCLCIKSARVSKLWIHLQVSRSVLILMRQLVWLNQLECKFTNQFLFCYNDF